MVHKTTCEEHILLCWLKTKCFNPRYDAVLYNVFTGSVFRKPKHTELLKEFDYKIQHRVIFDTIVMQLDNFIRAPRSPHALVWDESGPNKNDEGYYVYTPRHPAATPLPLPSETITVPVLSSKHSRGGSKRKPG